jgi:hypothetical protein
MSQFRHSSDILDRLPRGDVARSRIDQVEPGLFLGNMDAATDILSLEANRISHIVTVNYLHIVKHIPLQSSILVTNFHFGSPVRQ